MYGGGDVLGTEAYLNDGVWGVVPANDANAEVGWVDWDWEPWEGLFAVDGEQADAGMFVDGEQGMGLQSGVGADEEGAEQFQVGCDEVEMGDGEVWCGGDRGEGDAKKGKGDAKAGEGDAEEGEGDADDVGGAEPEDAEKGKAQTAVPGVSVKESGKKSGKRSGTHEVKVHGGKTKDGGKTSQGKPLGADKTLKPRPPPAFRHNAPLPLQPTQAKTLAIMFLSDRDSDDSNTNPKICACRRQLHHFCKVKTECSGLSSRDEVGQLLSCCKSCIVSYHPPIV